MLYKKTPILLKREIRTALQNIPGVGWIKSIRACAKSGLKYPYSTTNINAFIFNLISYSLHGYTWLDIRIKQFINNSIKILILTKSYHGLRHRDKLPVRGQRTRTNASTQKNK